MAFVGKSYLKRFQVKPKRKRDTAALIISASIAGDTVFSAAYAHELPQYGLEGALDGGLDIPHSDKRFAGFNVEGKQLDVEVHRKYIFGGHVDNYMREDEPEKYQFQFSDYIKKGIEPDGIEEMYKKVHAAIHACPTVKRVEEKSPKEQKSYNLKKLTYEERKGKLIKRLNAINSAAGVDKADVE